MNKKNMKKLLEEVGGLRHYLNLLESAERDPEMSLSIYTDRNPYMSPDMYILPTYDDGKNFYHQDFTSDVRIEHPWKVGEKSRRKYLRKFLVADSKGREGLLELIERKNQVLRRYLWEEVIGDEDQNP